MVPDVRRSWEFGDVLLRFVTFQWNPETRCRVLKGGVFKGRG